MGQNRPLGGTCALALQAALLAARVGTELSLGMCEGSLLPPLGLQPQLYLHLRWLAGVALAALFSVGLILNDFEPNRKGRSLAAVAWLKQSSSQGHGFGICR